MKRLSLFFVLLISYMPFYCQDLPGDFLNANDRLVQVPQSPEVAAFQKYGDHPVNLYTGTPSIAIPIYTFNGLEMSLPISLTYDASGIKVDQLASNVGLGWNLNFGGVVSRQTQGHPDGSWVGSGTLKITDNTTRDVLENITDAEPAYNKIFGQNTSIVITMHVLYENYLKNLIDIQADTFSFNVNGLSGTLVIDYTQPYGNSYKVYCIEDPTIEAEWVNMTYWKIRDSGGTTYYFNKAEQTEHTYSSATLNEYVTVYDSAWYLTKMISPNGLDTFEFVYNSGVYWGMYDNRQKRHDKKMTNYLQCVGSSTESNNELPAESKHRIKQFQLTEIKHNSISVLSTTLNNTSTKPRKDITGSRYFDKLTIKDEFTNPIVVVDFHNDDYFRASSSQTDDSGNSRLKLDSLSFYRNDSSKAKKYEFAYINEDNVPSRYTNGVDYWGYYRGGGIVGGDLIPDTDDPAFPTVTGIDRSSVFNYTDNGSLLSITYPTGGKTTFEYEPHYATTGPSVPDGVVGGLRLDKQVSTTQDPTGSATQTKYYYYGDIVADVSGNPSTITTSYLAAALESSGIAQQSLLYTEIVEIDDITEPCNNKRKRFYQHANNRAIQVPNAITYSKVSEIIFKNGSFVGCTVSEFYNDDYADGGLPLRPFYNEKLLNGELYKQFIYNSDLDLVQSSENTYENKDLGVPSGFAKYNGIYLYVDDNQNGGLSNISPSCKYYDITPIPPDEYHYYYGPADCNQCMTYSGVACVGYSTSYQINRYDYKQYHKRLLSSKSTTHISSSSLVEQSNYSYFTDSTPTHYFATEVSKANSKGLLEKTKIFYVADKDSLINYLGYPSSSLVILDTLLNRNQISTPIYVEKFYDNSQTSAQRKIFQVAGQKTLGSETYDIIRPEKIEVAKGTLSLEERFIYQSFDSDGNPQEVSQPDGTITYYIWGYNGKHLIAEIKNKSGGTLPTSLITAAVNASNADVNSTTEDTLRTALSNLRADSFFDDSMVTTFTYDPGIGVTSITDPKGYTMFYEYDQHNRLERVVDADDNIVGENQYSYRINN